MGRHGLYSGQYSKVFVAPKNAWNAETKHQSGAVPILLLTLFALMTSNYSSIGVLQGLNPRRQLLKASVYHSATSAISSGDILTCSRYPTKLRWWLLHVGVSLPPQSWHLLSGLITRLASDLSWACQKVQLCSTFVSRLHHLPPRMKNQHGLNEEKTFIGKK